MKDFYLTFENQFRGTEELIIGRLNIYRPFLQILKESNIGREALDLGCGRGEWLEVLREEGFNGTGIDFDEDMVNFVKGKGLRVKKDDVLEALKSIDSNSLTIVTAFHLIEHLSFDKLLEIISEAFRVLKNGGLLILETPNSENLRVGSEFFYIDPTHIKPVPSSLLAFLAKNSGFEKVKILRINEPWGIMDKNPIDIIDVFNGVSPDYSLLAVKPNTNSDENWDKVFKKSYGVSLDEITKRYQDSIKDDINNMKEEIVFLKKSVVQLENDYKNLLNSFLNSKSWKITAPLRKITKILKRLF